MIQNVWKWLLYLHWILISILVYISFCLLSFGYYFYISFAYIFPYPYQNLEIIINQRTNILISLSLILICNSYLMPLSLQIWYIRSFNSNPCDTNLYLNYFLQIFISTNLKWIIMDFSIYSLPSSVSYYFAL